VSLSAQPTETCERDAPYLNQCLYLPQRRVSSGVGRLNDELVRGVKYRPAGFALNDDTTLRSNIHDHISGCVQIQIHTGCSHQVRVTFLGCGGQTWLPAPWTNAWPSVSIRLRKVSWQPPDEPIAVGVSKRVDARDLGAIERPFRYPHRQTRIVRAPERAQAVVAMDSEVPVPTTILSAYSITGSDTADISTVQHSWFWSLYPVVWLWVFVRFLRVLQQYPGDFARLDHVPR